MVFRTSIKEEADFAQLMLMQTYKTNVSIFTTNRIGKTFKEKYIRKTKEYTVRVCKTNFFTLPNAIDVSTEHTNMYCFTTSSSF
jgi:hypothetical protein